jgi:anti-sigma factor RsiW
VTCPRTHDVGVFLLGALPPDEHAAFEAHLADCATCRAERDALGDLPALLALAETPGDDRPGDVVPPAVLRGALDRQRRERGRRRVLLAAGALVAAVAAFAAGIGVSVLAGSSPPPVTRTVALDSVGDAPVHGAAQLTPVAWGTRLHVECLARRGVPSAPPAPGATPTVYVLVLRAADGTEQQIARWSPPPGQDVGIDASTDVPAGGVSGLEVRTSTGRVVMRG